MSEIEMSEKFKSEEIAKGLEEIEKEINEQKKDEKIVGEAEDELQQEKKTYINLLFCQISVGIIFTYIYIVISILMNVINRAIFHTYKFKFSYTILFFQQFFCLLVFIALPKYSKAFKKKVGEISFEDFYKLKKNYVIFTSIIIINNVTGFIGSQLITNTAMYLTLRKLVLVMIYLNDICIGKKKLSTFTSSCILLVTFGSVLAGIEDFTTDYIGYIYVLMYNTFTVLYNKITETFKKDTGITNLKLLVYNSFLSCPILFTLILLTGEYNRINIYFTGKKIFEGSYGGLFMNLFASFSFCVALIFSYFISNEKNSSLFTAMLSNSKDIAISVLSYFWLKETKFSPFVIGGLLISTIGAVLISVKSMMDNLKTKEYKPIQNNEDNK